jgi:hypothetical protein
MQAVPTFKPTEPIWRVRLQLLGRGLKSSWAMFAESKIGLTGLGIIIFFALFGALWPIYPWLMEHIAWTPEGARSGAQCSLRRHQQYLSRSMIP